MTMSPGDPGPTDPPGLGCPAVRGPPGVRATSTTREAAPRRGDVGAPPARSRATSEGARRPHSRAAPRRPTSSRRRIGGPDRARRRCRRRHTRGEDVARTHRGIPHRGSSSPGSGTCSAPTTASAARSSGGWPRALAGRRPGDRLRHPRPAPGLRPARPWDVLVLVDALPDRGRRRFRRRARRRTRRRRAGPAGRRARHGPGDRARLARRPRRQAARPHRRRRLPGRRHRRRDGPDAAGGGGGRRGRADGAGAGRRDLQPAEVV